MLSAPVAALSNYVTSTTVLPDRTVNGSAVLPQSGSAYELELDISWDVAANVGVSVGRSNDGTRHTNIGKYADELYVDRAASDQGGFSLVPYTRAAGPIDAAARSVHLCIFVDTQSVESSWTPGKRCSRSKCTSQTATPESRCTPTAACELLRNHHPRIQLGPEPGGLAGRAMAEADIWTSRLRHGGRLRQ